MTSNNQTATPSSDTSNRIRRGGLSYELTEHCNLRCAGCDHAAPWSDDHFASPAEFERDLTALAKVLYVDELKLCGGEPLLHPRLLEFLRIAKKVNIAEGIVLLTNGTLLHKMPVDAWQYLAEVRISVYPGVRRRYDAQALSAIAERYGCLFVEMPIETFNEVFTPIKETDETLVETIHRGCYSAVNCHTVLDGKYYRCSRVHSIRKRLKMIGKPDSLEMDGLDIHNSPNLFESLRQYLDNDNPQSSCRYCLGMYGKEVKQEQLNAKKLKEEINRPHLSARELLDPTTPRTIDSAVRIEEIRTEFTQKKNWERLQQNNMQYQ